MGFRRNHDGRVMVYTYGNTDYVMGEYLANHPMQYCIEEVLGESISRVRLPAEIVRYVVEHLGERRPIEWHRDGAWCHVLFNSSDFDVAIAEGYISPEGVARRRKAEFSISGFLIGCLLCRLAEAGNDQVAGDLEKGQRFLRAHGLVGHIPESWVVDEPVEEPVVL